VTLYSTHPIMSSYASSVHRSAHVTRPVCDAGELFSKLVRGSDELLSKISTWCACHSTCHATFHFTASLKLALIVLNASHHIRQVRQQALDDVARALAIDGDVELLHMCPQGGGERE